MEKDDVFNKDFYIYKVEYKFDINFPNKNRMDITVIFPKGVSPRRSILQADKYTDDLTGWNERWAAIWKNIPITNDVYTSIASQKAAFIRQTFMDKHQ